MEGSRIVAGLSGLSGIDHSSGLVAEPSSNPAACDVDFRRAPPESVAAGSSFSCCAIRGYPLRWPILVEFVLGPSQTCRLRDRNSEPVLLCR